MDYQIVINSLLIASGLSLVISDYCNRKRIDLWRNECFRFQTELNALRTWCINVDNDLSNIENHLFEKEVTEDAD